MDGSIRGGGTASALRRFAVALCMLVVAGGCSSSREGAGDSTTSVSVNSVTTSTAAPTSASTVPATTSSTTVPRPRRTTTSLFPPGAIPRADLVFADNTTNRIVVTDARLDEVGLIVPNRTDRWEALSLSRDRIHLFARKLDTAVTSPSPSGSGCDRLYDLDLRTRALRPVVTDANVLVVSPDGAKALVYWGIGCAAPRHQPTYTTAVRDLTTQIDRAIDLSATTAPATQFVWSPDGTRFAVEIASFAPTLARAVRVYAANGAAMSRFERPTTSQDVVTWTTDGLLLVDQGRDGTAVVRRYDPDTGRPTAELGRIPQIELFGRETPRIGQLFQTADTTYAAAAGGADTHGYAQIYTIRNGEVQLLAANWNMHYIGQQP